MWEHSKQPWEGRLQAASPCISLQGRETAAGRLGAASFSLNLGTLPKVTRYTHTPSVADDICETSTASSVIS